MPSPGEQANAGQVLQTGAPGSYQEGVVPTAVTEHARVRAYWVRLFSLLTLYLLWKEMSGNIAIRRPQHAIRKRGAH